MILKFNYIDNQLKINNDFINVIEIENRCYFIRLINDIILLNNGQVSDEIDFFDLEFHVINFTDKINIVIDYFNIDFDTKKYLTKLSNLVLSNISDEDKTNLSLVYKKIEKSFSKILNNIDLDISINKEFDIASLIKLLKLSINKKDNLFDNLLLLIDIEKILKVNKLIVFVNLKQYLKKEELVELYKYSIYNDVKILLIDSQCYGTTNKYEKKLIIDKDLDEIVI